MWQQFSSAIIFLDIYLEITLFQILILQCIITNTTSQTWTFDPQDENSIMVEENLASKELLNSRKLSQKYISPKCHTVLRILNWDSTEYIYRKSESRNWGLVFLDKLLIRYPVIASWRSESSFVVLDKLLYYSRNLSFRKSKKITGRQTKRPTDRPTHITYVLNLLTGN